MEDRITAGEEADGVPGEPQIRKRSRRGRWRRNPRGTVIPIEDGKAVRARCPLSRCKGDSWLRVAIRSCGPKHGAQRSRSGQLKGKSVIMEQTLLGIQSFASRKGYRNCGEGILSSDTPEFLQLLPPRSRRDRKPGAPLRGRGPTGPRTVPWARWAALLASPRALVPPLLFWMLSGVFCTSPRGHPEIPGP